LLNLHFFVAESNLFTYLADGGLLRFAGQGLSRFVEVGSYGLYVGVPIVNDDGNDVVGRVLENMSQRELNHRATTLPSIPFCCSQCSNLSLASFLCAMAFFKASIGSSRTDPNFFATSNH